MSLDAELIVIGSGAAGLMAALSASPAREVLLITDRALGRSNTAMAQGGLQLPRRDPASLEALAQDMRRSARAPLDEARLARFVAAVPDTVDQLVGWGLELERGEDGAPLRRVAGGLSAPRVVNTPRLIGPSLIRVLRERLEESEVQVMARCPVQAIEPAGGALRVRLEDGRALTAAQVIGCSGGVSWREAARRGHVSTNPPNRNHALYDSLAAMGLPRVAPDAYQHHPFGLLDTLRDGVGACVPESVTGFPVRLLDRFGRSLGPIRQDRLALSQAMFEAAAQGRALEGPEGRPGFTLTLSELPPGALEAVFPKVYKRQQQQGRVGADVLVFPFLHYQLGGFAVDPSGRTGRPGLWLAGEMVGGLHGLNRLMGMGLTDSLVCGRLTGLAAASPEGW